MVGQNSKLSGMTFAVRMKKYLHKPFREGACGPDAYDCVGLIYNYVKEIKNIPDTFGPWNLANYYTLARGNTIREKAVLRDWLLTLGIEVRERVAGDLLLVKNEEGVLFPAIYTGNSRAITVLRKRGIQPFSLLKLETVLVIRIR